MIHSDQGVQFTSRDWSLFLSQHDLEASMSRWGNRHDNAVAENSFQLLKRERIRRRTYLTREAPRQGVFEYIEMFYNPKRKNTNNGMLSPVDFETQQHKMIEPVVQETRGNSKTGVAMRFKGWRMAAKGGIDGLFSMVIVVLSLLFAAFQANLLLRLLPDTWMVSVFLALFLFNTALLIWLWKRFGPTADCKREMTDED